MIAEICVAILVALCIYKLLLTNNKLSGIPGPRQWPIVGNTLQVDTEKPHTTLLKWAKEFGAVFKIKLGGTDTLVVTGTSEIHEMLVKRGEEFANRDKMYRLKISSMDYTNLIFRDYDDKFKWMKKIMFKGLKQHNLKFIEDITIEVVDDFLDDIKELRGKPFDPTEHISSVLYQIVYIMVFSEKLDKFSPISMKLRRAFEESLEAESFFGWNALLDLFPWLRFFGHKAYKQLMETQEVERELYSAWKQQVKDGEIVEGWFIELLEAHNNNPEFLSEDNVLMLVIDFFAAGTLTTSTTILTFINVLAHNPEVQKSLQEEVDAVIESSGHVAFKDRDKMPYTYACILEVLRYATAVSLGVPHSTTCDTTLAGFSIPKETQVLVNMWGQHHDPDLFPDPMDFKPERFLTNEGKMVLSGEDPRKHLVPFGAGTRVCAGETLAMTRLFIIFARLAQHFTVYPATTIEDQPSIHPHDFKLGSILYPKPYQVRMESRC